MSGPIVVVRVNPAKTLSIANNIKPAIKDQQATERRSYHAKVTASAVQINAPANATMKATSMLQSFRPANKCIVPGKSVKPCRFANRTSPKRTIRDP
jgi:hypothetical protein